jgi:hypothetical protein
VQVEHTFEVVATCPVDKAGDVYQVTVRCGRVIFVEDIWAAVKKLNEKPTTQEEFNQNLHRELAAEVETLGWHSGVTTRVVCGG